MTAFAIPTTTLAVGPHSFGPFTDTNFSFVTLTIDRTPAGGLNSLTTDSKLDVTIEMSNDGGASWNVIVGTTLQGGQSVDRFGNPWLADKIEVQNLVHGALLRSSTNVRGPVPIVVAGSLTAT